MKYPLFTVIGLGLVALCIYLFVSAPAPLPEATTQEATIPVEKLFQILEAENDSVRALWTQEIVTKGKEAGLAFNENWRDQGIDAGPLPALFLRETAFSLEKNPVQLSLFLGSDYPINTANNFAGIQLTKFELIRKTNEAQFFYDDATSLYTAMFSDTAVVQGCVDCHNAHKDSPKKDWQLNEVMGATTWLYPHKTVSYQEMLVVIDALHTGFADAYTGYLDKVATFANPPEIGDHWPRDGYYLPSKAVFMQAVYARTSAITMEALLHVANTSEADK